jgi:hypothetical protein
MEFPSPYWNAKTKIELLQRWLLVHSFIYYELNNNVVSDEMYDMNSKQLAEMQNKYPDDFIKSKYYYAMKEFDGSTGFGFVEKLTADHYERVTRDAYMITQRK